MLTTLCHFFFIIFNLTFESNDFQHFYQLWIQLLILLIPIDILIKLNSGFFENGSSISDRSRILQKYIKTELPYDFICFVIIIVHYQFQALNINWEGVKIIQIFYFVKIPIFSNLLENFEEIINFDERVEAFLSLLKHFVKILFFAHLTACIWFYLGSSPDDEEGSWLETKGFKNKTVFFQYLASLYWAITTISTTGYGDITAQNETEFVFCMIVMILGSIFFGYSLTYIGIVFDKLHKEQNMKKSDFFF